MTRRRIVVLVQDGEVGKVRLTGYGTLPSKYHICFCVILLDKLRVMRHCNCVVVVCISPADSSMEIITRTALTATYFPMSAKAHDRGQMYF